MENSFGKTEGTVIVKVGTNVLMKNNVLDEGVMASIASQIFQIRESGLNVVLITSGAVAAGRSLLKNQKNANAKNGKQALSSLGHPIINALWEKHLGDKFLCAPSFVEDHDFETVEGRRSMRSTLSTYQSYEADEQKYILPIINGNDFVTHGPIDTDNDKIAGEFAVLTRAKALYLLTNTDGIYDGDPKDETSKLIKEVRLGIDSLGFKNVFKGVSSGGTGGMSSKFAAAEEATQYGTEVYIGNGKKQGIINKMRTREEGTRVRHVSVAGL